VSVFGIPASARTPQEQGLVRLCAQPGVPGRDYSRPCAPKRSRGCRAEVPSRCVAASSPRRILIPRDPVSALPGPARCNAPLKLPPRRRARPAQLGQALIRARPRVAQDERTLRRSSLPIVCRTVPRTLGGLRLDSHCAVPGRPNARPPGSATARPACHVFPGRTLSNAGRGSQADAVQRTGCHGA